jgi:hypothetical protein
VKITRKPCPDDKLISGDMGLTGKIRDWRLRIA